MFFSSKNKESESLRALEEQLAKANQEKELYEEMVGFTQKELIVSISNAHEIVYKNEFAQLNIKDEASLIKELTKNHSEINLNGCSGVVKSKQLQNGNTLYSIVKTDIRTDKDSTIMSKHQNAIKYSLNDSQSTYVGMLEDLKEMKHESSLIAICL